MRALWFAAVLGTALPCYGADTPTITFSSLLDEMVDRDSAARFPNPAYRCLQASSYDRASVSPDQPETWWANNDRSFFLREEEIDGRKEWVMLDADGPGCIVRIWITARNACGTLRVYVDGSDEPVIAAEAQRLIGDNELLGPPLSETCARGRNFYLPIPYARHCKITYDRPNFQVTKNPDDLLYYQINYRTYEPGAPVQSFKRKDFDAAKDKLAALKDTLLHPDRAVATAPRQEAIEPLELAPGASTQITLDGPAAIRRLRIRLDAEDLELATRQTVLAASFDGEDTVWCPVGDFFGSGVGINPFTDWWRAVSEDGSMTCYWTMPFRRRCTMTLTNHGKQPVTLRGSVEAGPWTWDDRSMYFHTNWRREKDIDTATKRDWNYLHAHGQGVFMGDTLCIVNPVKAWWGEGDEKIYVDGEPFPSHFGTGTEDYYGYAWCTPEFFQSPFHAQPRADGPNNFGHVTNSRVRLLDGIPFRREFRFDMEVWHWRACKVSYAVATHWYGRPSARGNYGPDIEALEVDRVELPPEPKPRRVEGALEGEELRVVSKTGGETQIQAIPQFNWSSGKQLWWIDGEPGDRLVLAFSVPTGGTYELSAALTKAVDYGIVQLSLDGKSLGNPIDLYNDGVIWHVYSLGRHQLTAGDHELIVEIAGAHPKAVPRHMFGLDYIKLDPVQ